MIKHIEKGIFSVSEQLFVHITEHLNPRTLESWNPIIPFSNELGEEPNLKITTQNVINFLIF
jgi:hypothetical protein